MPRTPLTPLTAYRASGTVKREPLLTTKLYAPHVRSDLVSRPRLTDQLNKGLAGRLILITAPAGFGKTTLLGEWIQQNEPPTAWLSLDENDNDPVRFLAYTASALQTIFDGVEEAVLEMLASPEPPHDQVILTTLVNLTANAPQHFVFILDDYHVIENLRIHESIGFLLDHMPPQMHIVIISRTEPAHLPLARLRARNQLAELRATDLRFSFEEIATFLNEVMGLGLSAADVEALEARTEGWVASLQLAAISMQGRDDIPSFIADFTGDNRYVLDYLAEEVLHRQQEDVQHFLLKTSILDRLSAPLADYVTGHGKSQMMLDTLDAANLIIPLDDKRRWYRYHHLFAGFLREHLRQTNAAQIAELHGRAAAWYENNNLLIEAVHHTLAIDDYENAARLVEQVGRLMLMRAENTTLLSWMKTLPDGLVKTRPKLCLIHAWALAIANHMEAAESRLKDAERELGVSEDTSSTVLRRSSFAPGQTQELDEIFGEVVAIRTILALRKSSDIPRIIRLSQQALDRLPETSYFLRGVINFSLAEAYWLEGEAYQASKYYEEAATTSQTGGSLYVALLAIGNLVELEIAQGNLTEAYNTCQRFFELSAQPDNRLLPLAGWAYLDMGAILLHWNDLDAAEQHILHGINLIDQDESTRRMIAGGGHLLLAQLNLARGEYDLALTIVDSVEQFARRYNIGYRLVETAQIRAQILLEQGNIVGAEQWAQKPELYEIQQNSERWLDQQLLLACIRVAENRFEESLAIVDQILTIDEPTAAKATILAALLLKAKALLGKNHPTEAQRALQQAVTDAEPGGYILVFVQAGPLIETMLRQMTEQMAAPNYMNKILAAFADRSISPASSQPLEEPLSERELDVLQKIADGLSNREIADQLYVAVSTVKTHINNIYSKLHVNSRTQALARARELNILD